MADNISHSFIGKTSIVFTIGDDAEYEKNIQQGILQFFDNRDFYKPTRSPERTGSGDKHFDIKVGNALKKGKQK